MDGCMLTGPNRSRCVPQGLTGKAQAQRRFTRPRRHSGVQATVCPTIGRAHPILPSKQSSELCHLPLRPLRGPWPASVTADDLAGHMVGILASVVQPTREMCRPHNCCEQRDLLMVENRCSYVRACAIFWPRIHGFGLGPGTSSSYWIGAEFLQHIFAILLH